MRWIGNTKRRSQNPALRTVLEQSPVIRKNIYGNAEDDMRRRRVKIKDVESSGAGSNCTISGMD